MMVGGDVGNKGVEFMKHVRWVVGCREHETLLIEHLSDAAEYLATLDIEISTEQKCVGGYCFVGFDVRYEETPGCDLVGVCRRRVASAVAKTIVDGWEPVLLNRELQRDYDFLEPDECSEICTLAGELVVEARRSGTLMADEARGIIPRGADQPDADILRALLAYLKESHLLIIDGFVAFRLPGYVEALGRIVQKAVDAFLVEREYREFVRLLRYFVDVQEPRVAEVHVFIKQGDAFEVQDDEGNTMDDKYLNELVAELAETEVSHEDLLVSVLITLAPKHITLHCPAERLNEEAVQTVRDVFYRRVRVCTGCSDCSRASTESE
jgi:putative sporulation protein YtxC